MDIIYRLSDSDLGLEEKKEEFKKEQLAKYIILDNSGQVAMIPKDDTYRLPKSELKTDTSFDVDGIPCELNSSLGVIEEIRGEQEISYDISVIVARATKKDDILIKWMQPEEVMKIIGTKKKSIELEDYNEKYEILEDERILREYFIKFIY